MSDKPEKKPRRIQRKRSKGWKLPADTICVTRGTQWENPYKNDDSITREISVYLFRQHLQRMKRLLPTIWENYIAPLRGKDLACWCKENELCHADILIEFANTID